MRSRPRDQGKRAAGPRGQRGKGKAWPLLASLWLGTLALVCCSACSGASLGASSPSSSPTTSLLIWARLRRGPRATGHGHDDCVWHWLPERADIWRMDRAKAVQQGVKDPRLQCLLIGATTILALVPILAIIDRKCRPASLHPVAFNLEDV